MHGATGSKCKESNFYENSLVQLYNICLENTDYPTEIYGVLKNSLSTKQIIEVSFNFKNTDLTSLSQDKQEQIKNIVNSIVYLP